MTATNDFAPSRTCCQSTLSMALPMSSPIALSADWFRVSLRNVDSLSAVGVLLVELLLGSGRGLPRFGRGLQRGGEVRLVRLGQPQDQPGDAGALAEQLLDGLQALVLGHRSELDDESFDGAAGVLLERLLELRCGLPGDPLEVLGPLRVLGQQLDEHVLQRGAREFLVQSQVRRGGRPAEGRFLGDAEQLRRAAGAPGDLQDLRLGRVALVAEVDEGRCEVVELVARQADDVLELAQRHRGILRGHVGRRAEDGDLLGERLDVADRDAHRTRGFGDGGEFDRAVGHLRRHRPERLLQGGEVHLGAVDRLANAREGVLPVDGRLGSASQPDAQPRGDARASAAQPAGDLPSTPPDTRQARLQAVGRL
jgi:hypothetical protein